MDSRSMAAVRSGTSPVVDLVIGGLVTAVVGLALMATGVSPFYGFLAGPMAYLAAAGLLWRLWRMERPAQWGWANRVTGLRLLWTLSLVPMILSPGFVEANLAFVAAGSLLALVLDGVDGWLARRTGSSSGFGARFDMETDALLMLFLAVMLVDVGRAGLWVLGLGLMRYAFMAAGRVWPWLQRPLPGSRRRKAVCVVQVAALILALVPAWPIAWAPPLLAVALVLLTLSFAIDVIWLGRRRSTAHWCAGRSGSPRR